MTTKREAQAALDELRRAAGVGFHVSDPLQSLIDAMPPDPESRAERLGRVCWEEYQNALVRHNGSNELAFIAAAAAVEAECPKPREVTTGWVDDQWEAWLYLRSDSIADRINRYVRGEDA